MAVRGPYAKGSARREEILQAAMATIAANGYHGTTLRDIGRDLGLEPTHILYYFQSREELLAEVIRRWDSDSLAIGGDGADAIEVFMAAIRRNLEIPGIVQLYLSFASEAIEPQHAAHEFLRDRFGRMTREFIAALEAGRAAGLVRIDVDAARASRAIIGLSEGLQLQWLMGEEIDVPADLEAVISGLFVDGRRRHIPLAPDYATPAL